MTSILALETSGTLCSVALDCDGNCFERTQHLERRHNELLLGMIAELCDSAGQDVHELDAIAFGCGPGSFTGVRIAAAAVQGMALALDVPVLPIPSSQILAQAWQSGLDDASDVAAGDQYLVTSIRSRSQLYYVAAYHAQQGKLQNIHTDILSGSMQMLAWFDDLPANRVMVGEQPDWWTGLDFEALRKPTAVDVLALAREKWALGGALDGAAALPLYVSGDSPWRRSGATGNGK